MLQQVSFPLNLPWWRPYYRLCQTLERPPLSQRGHFSLHRLSSTTSEKRNSTLCVKSPLSIWRWNESGQWTDLAGTKMKFLCECARRREGEDEKEDVRRGKSWICVCEGERRREKRWEGDVRLQKCVWECVLMAVFVLACVHLHRGERIWQVCLLSPQNNCLWIT